jgi:hypothetical protein
VLGWAGGLGLALFVPGCADDEPSEQSAAGRTTAPTTTAGTTSPDCVLTPELTEGPYYLDLDLMRRDISEGRPGLAYDLAVKVVDAESCEPIEDAIVDVWHCDAEGVYSGVQGDGGTFLRGVQVADGTGTATFRIVLTQGLNRQIRRMCSFFGYKVLRLQRVRIINLTLEGLGLRVRVVDSCSGGTIVVESDPIAGTPVRENDTVALILC